MELAKKLDDLGVAFEEFKKINDQRLKEISEKGRETSDTTTKLAKAEADIQRFEKSIEQLNAALARKNQGVDEKEQTADEKKSVAFKAAFDKYVRKGVEGPELKEMTVDSDQDGGFLVSPEMSSEIVKKVFESSPVRQLASVQSISSDSLEMGEDLDEAAASWVGERASRAVTDSPVLKQIKIPVYEMYSEPKATQKLLDDAQVNVEAWLASKVSDKFARKEATAFVSGTGVTQPMGILGYGTGNGFGLIERQLTASNSAIVGEDLIDVQSLLKEPYQGNASWLINRLIIAVIRKLKDTVTGQYIWQPGLMVGAPNVLLGRPVYMASDLPSAIAATTDTIIYGDIRAGYQVVDRAGIRILRDPFSSKPYVLFYTTKRVGGGVKNFEAIKVLKMKT